MVDKIKDVWASDEEEVNYDKLISLKEWERMSENFGNVGYKEGIIEGKNLTIQEGFNEGYIEGAKFGKELGRLRGLLNTLLALYTLLPNTDNNDINNINQPPTHSTVDILRSLENDLANLTVDNVFTNDHFKITLESTKNDVTCGCFEGSYNTDEVHNEEKLQSTCGGEMKNETCNKKIKSVRSEISAERLLIGYSEKVNALLGELGDFYG